MADDPAPLASGEAEAKAAAEPDDRPAESAPARPAGPSFKPSTFVLTFLFLFGIFMIVDAQIRIQVAGDIVGALLWPLLGFSGAYPLATMCIAAIVEMLATAVAYNWATDWVKAARVQSWNSAFRKVQLSAMRSGRKDRIEALAPHQQKLTQASTEVSFAQLKGMAVTWFLVIAIYTWVYLFLTGYCPAFTAPGSSSPTFLSPWGGTPSCVAGHMPSQVNIAIAGSTINLVHTYWIIPLWFLVFTFYTVPFSLLFRRILKHVTLRRYADRLAQQGAEAPSGAGRAA